MSGREVAWRMQCSLRDVVDRCLIGHRGALPALSKLLLKGDQDIVPGFRVTDHPSGKQACQEPKDIQDHIYQQLICQANSIGEHRLSFFDLQDKYLGDPIDWNRDHKSAIAAPMRFAPAIDYRNFNVTGDCKFVWEPNRHHQFVTLARAYQASQDVGYGQAVAQQLDSWLKQCPFGMGMNWRSGLELGVRLINWTWAYDMIRDSGLISGQLLHRFLQSVYLHMWEISRKYSAGSSVGNHLIGEAAGVFIAGSYFSNLKNASRLRDQSREILCDQIIRQSYPDGGPVEQAMGYHLFVLELLSLAGIVARKTDQQLADDYWNRLEKMFEFLQAFCQGGAKLPMLGDCDDGYVLDHGCGDQRVRWLMATGAELFGRNDFEKSPDCRHEQLTSRAFPDTGYYLLQHGSGAQRISVVFDCGPLGLEPLAGHGHADALSLTLRAFGLDVLIDPGTYDYFTYPQWRQYFRSTRAHNTITIDGQDQSEMMGPFMWSSKARAQCMTWQPNSTGGKITSRHDGFRRLGDPVVHQRTVELDGPNRQLVIDDNIVAKARHEIALYLHIAENCTVIAEESNRYRIDTGRGQVVIELDKQLSVEVLTGSGDPMAGWVSRGYHRKVPGATLLGRCIGQGTTSLQCLIQIGNCVIK